MSDVYISSIPTDADMDIIGQCIETNFSMRVETHPPKHGEGEPLSRPLTKEEQEAIKQYEATR